MLSDRTASTNAVMIAGQRDKHLTKIGSDARDSLFQFTPMRGGLIGRRQWLAGTALAAAGLPGRANNLPDLVVAAKPSVCAVGTYSAVDNPRFGFRGSGFFVGDGSLVATCWHVLPEAAAGAASDASSGTSQGRTLAIQLTRPDGLLEAREAELLSSERTHDLALLKIKGRSGPPLTLAEATARPREGSDVALMGFPIGGVLGFRHVTHRGILASVVTSSLPTASARQLDAAAVARLRQGSFELLQLDATAYPGNSGGPLFDIASGQVIGIVNMVLVKANRESALSAPTGITYAVPVRYLHALMGKN